MDDRENENALQNVEEPTALAAITGAEVDVQVATAKRFPRTVSKFLKAAESLATIDRKTADSCLYGLPRGGKIIAGASIRLAEIIAGTWGNLRIDSRIIDVGREFITAQATAWDMETNLAVKQEVRRRITDKNGNRYKSDMIIMTGNAAISIAIRNAVFRVVPRSLVDKLYDAARVVAVGNAQTMIDRRAAALATFAKMGVTPDRVLAVVDKPSAEDINAEDLGTLLGLLNAIRDGATTVDRAFPQAAPEASPAKGTDAVLDALTSQASHAETPAPATQPAPDDQGPPDPPPEGSDGPQTSEPPARTAKQELLHYGIGLDIPEDVIEDILATENISHRSRIAGQPYIRARAAIEDEAENRARAREIVQEERAKEAAPACAEAIQTIRESAKLAALAADDETLLEISRAFSGRLDLPTINDLTEAEAARVLKRIDDVAAKSSGEQTSMV